MEDVGKQTQVSAQIARQNDALARLADMVGKLEECLGSVLRPEDNIRTQNEPEEELVRLATQMRDVADAIEAQAERLGQIRSRLEL